MAAKLQILVPIAGDSAFFDPQEYYFPKPLIEVGGKPMIERVVLALKEAAPAARFIFVTQQNDVAKFSLDAVLRLVAGEDALVIPLASPTQGALCSCLMAIDALDPEQPLLVCNGDQYLDADLAEIVRGFQRSAVGAGVVTFRSVHPRWSYVKLGDDGMVEQAAEKKVISDMAIAGVYYFRTAGIFLDAAMEAISADDHIGGSFFIAQSLNQIILRDLPVGISEIPAEAYHSFYSPQKIKDFTDSLINVSVNRKRSGEASRVTLIVPAAGEGSRFAKAGWRRAKPFIDIAGRSMVEHVLDNVSPRKCRKIMLLREQHLPANPESVTRILRKNIKIVPIDKLTEGTICTILLARKEIPEDEPVLIANSDQVAEFSVDDFIQDCLERDLDGSILVFRDAERNPKWSFAKVDSRGLVEAVAEKVPISDFATVGIYFFRRGRDMIDAAIDMIAANDRVNNEFYTCPVYNYMITSGLKIGIFEVPAAAMHGLGTPEDLQAYLQVSNLPVSADAPLS